MELNKSYYIELDSQLNFKSAEVDHKLVAAEDFEVLRNTLESKYFDGQLLVGTNVECVGRKRHIRGKGLIEETVYRGPANIEVADGAVCKFVEISEDTHTIRAWIQDPDYVSTREPKRHAAQVQQSKNDSEVAF